MSLEELHIFAYLGLYPQYVYIVVVGNATGQSIINEIDSMDFKSKVVTTTPLTELWMDEGLLDAKRGRQLSTSDLQEILNDVIFVVADVGQKLNWIKKEKVFDFWKTDLQKHFLDKSDKIKLDNFPDGYAYLATEWTDKANKKIILLEKFH